MSEYLKPTDYVNAYDLSRDKRTLKGKVRLSDLPRAQAFILPSEEDAEYEITGLTGRLGWPGASMKLKAHVQMICNRCTRPMDYELDREVVFRFAKSEEEADAMPIEEDDEVEVIVGSDKLNILDWIEEELILSLPLVPAHEDPCLSPESSEKASEPLEAKENPFAKLKELKGLRKQ